MAISEERKKRGLELLKKYRAVAGNDVYAAASDAIADILLAVALSEEEATQVLHSAEVDYRGCTERESFAAEG